MTDIVDTKQRRELMAGIRGRKTVPELAVAQYENGYWHR